MPDSQTIALYDARAADYAAQLGKLTKGAALRLFCEGLPAGGRVLDLGCGAGTASALMQRDGFDVDPVDASAGMVRYARDQFGLPARQADFDALEAEAEYDGVWANFSLTHAAHEDLPRHLAAIARALRPGGLLHLGMKTGSGSLRDDLGRFYALHSTASLRAQLEEAGFAITHQREGLTKGFAGTDDPFVILQARHG